MEHVVLAKFGRPYKVGEEVIITNPKHTMCDKSGEITKIRNYNDVPKIWVMVDGGETTKCKPEDLS